MQRQSGPPDNSVAAVIQPQRAIVLQQQPVGCNARVGSVGTPKSHGDAGEEGASHASRHNYMRGGSFEDTNAIVQQ